MGSAADTFAYGNHDRHTHAVRHSYADTLTHDDCDCHTHAVRHPDGHTNRDPARE